MGKYKIIPTLGKLCLVVPENIIFDVFKHTVFAGDRKACEVYCERNK